MGPRGITTLLDSVILTDLLHGFAPAVNYVRSVGAHASISVITRAEVLTGCTAELWADTERFLSAFHTIAIDMLLADTAARLRQSEGWKLPDALLAATAVRNGLQLATRNTKDFPPEKYAFVIVPYGHP
jgi:predicted nucleic acid-binding protein